MNEYKTKLPVSKEIMLFILSCVAWGEIRLVKRFFNFILLDYLSAQRFGAGNKNPSINGRDQTDINSLANEWQMMNSISYLFDAVMRLAFGMMAVAAAAAADHHLWSSDIMSSIKVEILK